MTAFVSVGEAAAGVVGKLKRPLIDRPGVYAGITLDRYHSADLCDGPSASSSGLRKLFCESPAHYWCESPYNDHRIPPRDSEAMLLGRGAHHLLLGEDDFSTLYIMRPESAPDGRPWNGNNNTCKQWLRKQAEAGRTVLTSTQVEAIRGMARSLAADPLVQAGILNGDIEQTLVWRDKKTGIWLKARPDSVPNDSGDFCDLKTTSTWGEDLDWEIYKHRRYDMQAALVKWAAKEARGIELKDFSLVFVGSRPPHCVEVVTLHSADIEEAEADLRVAVDTFAHCLATGHWFGPSGTQSDCRYAHKPDKLRENHKFRREFLEREIAA